MTEEQQKQQEDKINNLREWIPLLKKFPLNKEKALELANDIQQVADELESLNTNTHLASHPFRQAAIKIIENVVEFYAPNNGLEDEEYYNREDEIVEIIQTCITQGKTE